MRLSVQQQKNGSTAVRDHDYRSQNVKPHCHRDLSVERGAYGPSQPAQRAREACDQAEHTNGNGPVQPIRSVPVR